MKKRITIAAYLAGATTLAVTLPAMAEAAKVGAVKPVVETHDEALKVSKPS